jgi:hypothetical protein
MAEENQQSSIIPLNAAAQKEAMPLTGMLLLAMIIVVAAVFVVGQVANLI